MMDYAEKRIVEFIRILASGLCREIMDDAESFSVEEEFDKFIRIYDSNYRHSYSKIFMVLNNIRKSRNNNDDSSFVNINANYEYIQSVIIPRMIEKGDHRYENAIKFFDHLQLEISRIGAWDEFEGRIEKYNQLVRNSTLILQTHEKQMAEMVEQTKADIRKEIDLIKKETDKIKTDFITILSIFVAIIMGFAGVVGFGGNIMASLNNIIIYKAIFMMLVSGLVLFNGIFLMLHIVAKLTGRSIAHQCTEYMSKVDVASENETDNRHGCESCKLNKCGIWKRVKAKFPYTAHFNEILVSGLLITLIAWIINHGALGWAINNDCTYIINEYRRYIYGVIILFILSLCYKLYKNKKAS